MPNSRGYRVPTIDDDPNVPVWNDRLAEDVAQDVDSLEGAMEGLESRTPTFASSPNHLAVVLDAERNETWLGARPTDGGPTDWAMAHLVQRLGVGPLAAPEYLFAVADAEKNLTDLAVRRTDGQFAQFVIDRLRPRILEGFTPPEQRRYADTKWTPDSPLFPVKADSTRAAGWGSSSMAGIDSRFAALFGSKGAAYYSGGKGAEQAQHIAARIGSTPALVTVSGGTIPASGPVDITTSNVPVSSALRPYPGTLAGVPGTISHRATSPASYIFTRTTDGAATPVPAGTPFIPDASSYRDAVVLLWMGKNNMHETTGATTAITLTDAAYDWLVPLAKRCLVLGHFVDTYWQAVHPERDRIIQTNNAHRVRYGRQFVDVSAYITGPQVWTDTGITPTATDLEQQALGNKPPSLSPPGDNGHFNAAGYDAVTNHLIAPRLTELGWY